jgi:iron complex outermembrane receptor protein
MELEAMFAVTSNLTVGTAIGYNHAEYDDFDNGQCTVQATVDQYYDNGGTLAPGLDGGTCTVDLAGEELDNSPEWTASSYLSYMKQITDNLVTISRVEHNYTDSFYLDQDLDSNLKNDSVHLVNLRFTLTNADNDWEATIWGTNVFDEEYYVVGIDMPTVGGYAGATAPDAGYGLTLRYNWY